MIVEEKDSQIDDLTQNINTLKIEYKKIEDELKSLNKPNIQELIAQKEAEMRKENNFLKESLESLGVEVLKLNEIKKREFKQRDKIFKME